MNSNDHNKADQKSTHDYIALAHQLRAEAMRKTFVAMFSGVKRALHVVSARLHRSANA